MIEYFIYDDAIIVIEELCTNLHTCYIQLHSLVCITYIVFCDVLVFCTLYDTLYCRGLLRIDTKVLVILFIGLRLRTYLFDIRPVINNTYTNKT